MKIAIAVAVAACVGYMFGFMRRDMILMRLLEDQQDRGDHWFDRYKASILEDWEVIEDE